MSEGEGAPALAVIAHIHNDFPTKFGLPRQAGLAPALTGRIVFQPAYRQPEALRGLSGFSHIWLIWGFSAARRERWSATVRPPRLGGNQRVGVFASRSPFRPNGLGLSCVRLEGIREEGPLGLVLQVSGADLMDGSPIYDIKPYLPYADSIPDARDGFIGQQGWTNLRVDFPEALLGLIPPDKRAALIAVLGSDPRPAYLDDPERVFGFLYAGFDVRFRVAGGQLLVCEVARQ
ncbi:MAG: tRNA (N6-threonylcarbamoyladenosine(37)-N6)-methyltransferase TrmO [Christensenellales bacterium]